MAELTISVIITNWMRQNFIPGIIDQLNSQTFPKDMYEVIIVDDDTPDKEEVYSLIEGSVNKHPDINIRLFETHKEVTFNPSLRYNIGARQAKNDIVLLNESDIIQRGEYLQRVADVHQGDRNLTLGPEIIHIHGDGREEVESFRVGTDLGASVIRSHYYTVTGFDERTRGWGGIEGDWLKRLDLAGVKYRKDAVLEVFHRAWDFCGVDYAKLCKDDIAAKPAGYYDGFPQFNGIKPNPPTWGTLDTLEEITF